MPANSGDIIFAGTVQKLSYTAVRSSTGGISLKAEEGSPILARRWVPGHYETQYVSSGRGMSVHPVQVWIPGHWEKYDTGKTVSSSDSDSGTNKTYTYTTTLCEFLKIHYVGTRSGDNWDLTLTAEVCSSSPGKQNYSGYFDGQILVNGVSVAAFSLASKNIKGTFGEYGVYTAVKNGDTDWSVTVHGITSDDVTIGIAPNPSGGKQKFCNSAADANSVYTFETESRTFSIPGGPPSGQNVPSVLSTRTLGKNRYPVVLDTNFVVAAIVDTYESFIWTERYNDFGDFELVLPASSAAVTVMQQGNYLYRSSSYYLMIIESIKLEADVEEGDRLIVSGRSLESILERRVIWNQTVFSEEANNDVFQNAIYTLLNDSMMNPTDVNRKIENVKFRWCTDPNVADLTVSTEFDGETVYQAVHDLCEAYGVGFRMLPDGDWNFIFELYSGVNHSYYQADPPSNSYVVFSPDNDNLANSNYLSTTEPYRNTALVAGEGEGAERKKAEITDSGEVYSGLERRELFVDAKGTSSKTEDDREMSDEEYRELLEGKGLEELANNIKEVAFDGEALPRVGFTYGADYSLGDIVQIQNAYGLGAPARVTEYIMSDSADGYEEYPTFEVIE